MKIQDMSSTAIGIDLGGTRIKGLYLKNGEVSDWLYLPTGEGEAFKDSVRSAVRELCAKAGVDRCPVGISAPGLAAADHRSIACMPGRLPGLEHFDWSGFLEMPTVVLNDAVCALMAEARLGVARNMKDVVMLTLGTGVGGAILIGGKPYLGALRKAGHWGHSTVDADGYADVTEMPGSIEEAIGDVSIRRRSHGRFRDTQELLIAAGENDPFAQWIWLSSVQKLAVSVAGISNALAPEAIVLGGGIAHAGEILFTPLRRFLDVYEWRPEGQGTTILKSHFSDLSGAAGAACFALEQQAQSNPR